MIIVELEPAPVQMVRFTLKYQRLVPTDSGCYALSTFDGSILYIGVSVDLNRRFAQHRDSQEKCDPTKEGLAFWFHWLACEEKAIFRVERSWLNQYVVRHGARPVLNKVDSPVP